MAGVKLSYHPKNTFTAFFMFALGVFFVWWVGVRVSIFTGFFTTTFPKAIIIVSFIIMCINWLVLIPYRTLTGEGKLFDTIACFYKGLKGIIISTITIIVGGSVLTSMATVTGIAGIAFVGWLLILGIVIKFSVYDVLIGTNEPMQIGGSHDES